MEIVTGLRCLNFVVSIFPERALALRIEAGRIWVDAATYDVLRVERRLRGPVDVEVPFLIQRRYRLDPWVVILRDDLTIRYQAVAFSDPDEVLLLPESIHIFTMIRGGLQSTRRNQTFSDYQRFITKGKVVD